MKNSIFILMIAMLFTACKEDGKKGANGEAMDQSKADTATQKNQPEGENMSKKPSEPDILTGVFIRNDSENLKNCDCNCVDVDFISPTPLCIDKQSGLSIMAMFKRVPDGSLIVYYVKPKNTEGVTDKDIPWDKFDTDVPIATITYSDSRNFKLDWKGFTVNGKIALDYAIYGKKNLEGNYVKK